MATVSGQHSVYKIAGVSVYFPCKPYPSQFSMMDKIIKGIERGQNCLLESPTGSGKSLAMLCSALGWQAEQLAKKEKEDEQDALDNLAREACCCQCHQELPKPMEPSPPVHEAVSFTPPTVNVNIDEGDEDDFKDNNTSYRTPNIHKDLKKLRKHVSISYEDDYTPVKQGDNCTVVKQGGNSTSCCGDAVQEQTVTEANCGCCWKNTAPRTRVPKIYFGTRTHKQVSQIVRELKKTAYHDVRMTILGSREYTCIHPAVSRSSNKNEGCAELLKGPGCRNYDRTKRLESQKTIKTMGLDSAWDLEDLVGLCKTTKACPYFLSRGLKAQSELIICPYNYLIDPLIRDSMELVLKDQIMILDEAHNIEDSSREAASQTIHLETLEKMIREIDTLVELNVKVGDHLKLKNMAMSLIDFINTNSLNLEQKDFEQASKIWSGFDIVAQLESIGLGPKHFPELISALASVGEPVDDEMKQRMGHDGKLPNSVMSCIEQIFLVCKNMYQNDMKFVEDYRVSLLKSTTYSNIATNGQWLNPKQRRGHRVPVVTYTLNFWCMNPAVAFSSLSDCRCIVLSSGTLSPMTSFQSELGLPFPIQLEASHVIKDNQVWVGAVGQGPTGTSLQAVYRNLETFNFQDELGQLVLKVCQTVPHGVLCFLPSYKVLEKLTQRWRTTGLWYKIRNCKRIVCEPRGKDKDDFEDLMKYFYKAIEEGSDFEDSDEDGNCETTGALFFAVCRGKVSEGLDFADNFARAVISVGIPYPNFKDLQVELKRKYNDRYKNSKGLLSGGDWYEIQAFRALNQALGRCIRHRRDWGSLILVDDRFVKNGQKYCKGLSKWVRNKVRTFHDFTSGMTSLNNFVQDRIENHETEQGAGTSFISSTPTTPGGQRPDVSLLSPKTPGTESKPQISLYSYNRDIAATTNSSLNGREDNSKISPEGSNAKNLASIFKLNYTPVNKESKTQTPVMPPGSKKAIYSGVATPTVPPTINNRNSGASTPGVQLLTSTPLKPTQSNVPSTGVNAVTPNGLKVDQKQIVTNPVKNNVHIVYAPPGSFKPGQLLNVMIDGKVVQVPMNGSDAKASQLINQKTINTQVVPKNTIYSGSHVGQSQFIIPSGSNIANPVSVNSPTVQLVNQQNLNKTGGVAQQQVSQTTMDKLKGLMNSQILEQQKTNLRPVSNQQMILLNNPIGSQVAQSVTATAQVVQPGTKIVNVANVNGQLVMLPQSGKQTINVANIGGKMVVVPKANQTSLLQGPTAFVDKIQGSGMNVAETVEVVSNGGTNQLDPKTGSRNNPIVIDNNSEANNSFRFSKIPESKKLVLHSNSEIPENESPNIESKKCEISVIHGDPKAEILGTPPLFDSEKETIDSEVDHNNTENKTSSIRKPLFKKKSENNPELKNKENSESLQEEDLFDSELKTVPATRNTRRCRGRLSLSNVKTNTEVKLEKMTKPENKTEVKVEESVVEKVKVEKKPESVDNLSIRRSSRMKRRRSSGNVRHAARKKSKGVEFLDDTDEDSPIKKQKSDDIKTVDITCCGCGLHLLNNITDHERRMRVPPFFPMTDGCKNCEIIFLPKSEDSDNLKPLSTQLGTGQQLNSLWCKEEKVCVEFLTCINCYPAGTTQQTFGCQVVYNDPQSSYHVGQMWLLSDKIKITNNT